MMLLEFLFFVLYYRMVKCQNYRRYDVDSINSVEKTIHKPLSLSIIAGDIAEIINEVDCPVT